MITATQAAVMMSGIQTLQRFRKAAIANQGTATIAIAASMVPPTLACNALTTFPRTSHDQEVVMPHDGHGLSKSKTKVHGGNPICSCVPRPWALGFSALATRSSVNSPNANKHAKSRVVPDNSRRDNS